MNKTPIIFLGNGPLADAALKYLEPNFNIVFHARTREDLETVKKLKTAQPELQAVLASFGVIIKKDLLDLFEPSGILNLHPSMLPKYRGASPIESAILNGDTTFGISIMKLVKAMDAGPVYYQKPVDFDTSTPKSEIYDTLAKIGVDWLSNNFTQLPTPIPQDEKSASFCGKFDKSMSLLTPETKSAKTLNNEIRAFLGFPKSRITIYDIDCIVHLAHVSEKASPLSLKCQDGKYLCIDLIQPAGKRPMDAKSFLNGYAK